MDALRRAERIAEEKQVRQEAQSLRHTLQAERLERLGLFDRALLDRALALDPDNERARQKLQDEQKQSNNALSPWARYTAALTICVVAIAGAGWILWTSRQPKRRLFTSEDGA